MWRRRLWRPWCLPSMELPSSTELYHLWPPVSPALWPGPPCACTAPALRATPTQPRPRSPPPQPLPGHQAHHGPHVQGAVCDHALAAPGHGAAGGRAGGWSAQAPTTPRAAASHLLFHWTMHCPFPAPMPFMPQISNSLYQWCDPVLLAYSVNAGVYNPAAAAVLMASCRWLVAPSFRLPHHTLTHTLPCPSQQLSPTPPCPLPCSVCGWVPALLREHGGRDLRLPAHPLPHRAQGGGLKQAEAEAARPTEHRGVAR